MLRRGFFGVPLGELLASAPPSPAAAEERSTPDCRSIDRTSLASLAALARLLLLGDPAGSGAPKSWVGVAPGPSRLASPPLLLLPPSATGAEADDAPPADGTNP
jgi:hypothetical protein